MNFQSKTHYSYKSELAFLSIMTLIFGFGCLFLGYLILPVAAGFYAALLSLEKKENRVLSYVVPLVPLVVNVFVNGFYSLEAVGYVIIGAIIFFGFDRKKNKAATVFLATLVLILLMLISLALLAFDQLGSFKFSVLSDFYTDMYDSAKLKFTEFVTSHTAVDEQGFVFHKFNSSEAIDIYNSIIFSLIPLSVIFALLVVGFATKLLKSRTMKYNADDARLVGWRFVTPPFIAYSYIVLIAFTSLSTQGIVGTSLSFVSSILMAIYFYIGISAVYAFISDKKGGRFAILSIIAIVFVFPSFAPEIISFIGIFVNNSLYKTQNSTDADV